MSSGRNASLFVLGAGAAAILATVIFKGVSTTMNIAELARNAGFEGTDLVTAVAVALAESGGNPNAYNPESDYFNRHGIDGTGKGSIGLWQIFSYAHPEFQGLNLYDPQTNANAAYAVYHAAGDSFKPWSTFTSGIFESKLSDAQNQVNA